MVENRDHDDFDEPQAFQESELEMPMKPPRTVRSLVSLLVLGILALALGVPRDGYAEDLSHLRRSMIEAVNRVRAERGLVLLKECISMDQAAQGHAMDMARQGELNHEGSDGSTFWERLCRANYRPGCGPSHWVGEILAAGNAEVSRTLTQWIESEGHFEILTHPKARYAGVGYIQTHTRLDSPAGAVRSQLNEPGFLEWELEHFWVMEFGASGDPSCGT